MEVEFLWITFRSFDHLAWFIMTMTGLCVAAATTALYVHRPSRAPVTPLWMLFGIMHVGISIKATLVTRFGTINGPMYSVDCIWYNALLAVICFGTALFLLRFDRRRRG